MPRSPPRATREELATAMEQDGRLAIPQVLIVRNHYGESVPINRWPCAAQADGMTLEIVAR